jgi:hypothetical protein
VYSAASTASGPAGTGSTSRHAPPVDVPLVDSSAVVSDVVVTGPVVVVVVSGPIVVVAIASVVSASSVVPTDVVGGGSPPVLDVPTTDVDGSPVIGPGVVVVDESP